MTENISNPWNILPVKNAKSARSCTEVHLSNQNIEVLGNFESFPNLEVVWLNNNKVLSTQIRRIEALDNNFRIKHFYIENNCLTSLDGSVKKFKFLQTFLAGNNNLRGLEKVLKILCKLTCIERLSKNYSDLYGNPCAEEPYYRQKVIVALPNLKIFDRHEVNFAERQRAETLIAKLQETGSTKIPKLPKKFEPSTGEKDLEVEIKKIKAKRTLMQQEQDRARSTSFAWDKYKENPAPIATKVKNISQYFGLCPENRISEWEKNEIKKLFWTYDKDKSGYLDFDEMSQVLRDIKDNKAGLGKVPVDDVPSMVEVMRNWDRNQDSKIQWREFRDGMNQFQWKLCDEEYLRQEIKNLYAKAKKEEMNGRTDSAKQLAMMAMRLEGLDTRTKSLMKEPEVKEKMKFRTDTFMVYRFKESLREVGVKTVYNSSKPLEVKPQMLKL